MLPSAAISSITQPACNEQCQTSASFTFRLQDGLRQQLPPHLHLPMPKLVLSCCPGASALLCQERDLNSRFEFCSKASYVHTVEDLVEDGVVVVPDWGVPSQLTAVHQGLSLLQGYYNILLSVTQEIDATTGVAYLLVKFQPGSVIWLE